MVFLAFRAMSDFSEEAYLLDLWERNICPNCGCPIPDGKRVGRGEKRLGGFCSLDCVAHYYQLEYIQRVKRLSEIARRRQDA
jgi:hypothetical protein